MAQVKKEEIRRAIINSAFELFKREGYVGTSLPMIAKGAGISSPNVYSYFPSKLAILYAIYDPWIRDQFATIEARLAKIDSPAQRLRVLLVFLWRELPATQQGFANNVIQAISTATPKDEYRTDLIAWLEAKIEQLVLAAIPARKHRLVTGTELSHMIVMTMDGYIMYRHTRPRDICKMETIDAFCLMLAGAVKTPVMQAKPER
jgi:AcrR family transcriptional regulator